MPITKLKDVAVFLFKKYPNRTQLSRARFVKLIYLADWKHAIEHGCQITGTAWYFNNYGPYVQDIINELSADPDFEVTEGENHFGTTKLTIGLVNPLANYSLSEVEIQTLDFVIQSTKDMFWDSFINLVYSTYPIRFSARHSNLNLVQLAKEYEPIRTKMIKASA